MFDKLKELAAALGDILTMDREKKRKKRKEKEKEKEREKEREKEQRPGLTAGPMSYLSNAKSKKIFLDQAEEE